MHHANPVGEVEDEANEFASEFLMPRSVIRDDLKNLTSHSAIELGSFWKVSPEALVRRAHRDFKYLPKARASQLYMMLKKYSAKEVFAQFDETPSNFDRLVEFHRNSLGYRPEDLCAILFSEPGALGAFSQPSDDQPQLRLILDEAQ